MARTIVNKAVALRLLAVFTALFSPVSSACLSSGTESTINSALQSAGSNGKVQLCPSSSFTINGPIVFAADGQELSTQGYPTGTLRASITISSSNSNNLTTLISGGSRSNIKILNLIVDGNRPAVWTIPEGSGANIELGGSSNGIVVSNVASRNARGWSCLHVIEGSTTWPYTCRNATISDNDIGPCGVQSAWADGISFACSASLVQNNSIDGPTDGGIVLFGAPGTTVQGNTITGSATERGWGAINMVDYAPYSGNFSGVTVQNNRIVGAKMFNVGIAIGSSVWSTESGASRYLSGPARVLNNSISGNVVFPIAVNGWKNGLTVSGTSTAGNTKPNYLFADANVGHKGSNDCTGQPSTWRVFDSNAPLSYWSPGIRGAYSLEPGFANSSSGDPNYFLCAYPAIPSSAAFAPGQLSATPAQGAIAFLHRGLALQFQADNNLVAVNYSSPSGAVPVWASNKAGYDCGGGAAGASCSLIFQADGNLVNYVNGAVVWASGTNNGQRNTMLVSNQPPWIQIVGPAGAVIWDTTKLK